MKHYRRHIAITLAAITLLLFVLSIFLSTTKNYTYLRSNQDARTTYWQPSDGPCNETKRNIKRPVIKVDTAVGFYITALLGGGISTNPSDITVWQLDQGNCPYQIMDIYELGRTYDIYAATVLFASLTLCFMRKQKR